MSSGAGSLTDARSGSDVGTSDFGASARAAGGCGRRCRWWSRRRRQAAGAGSFGWPFASLFGSLDRRHVGAHGRCRVRSRFASALCGSGLRLGFRCRKSRQRQERRRLLRSGSASRTWLVVSTAAVSGLAGLRGGAPSRLCSGDIKLCGVGLVGLLSGRCVLGRRLRLPLFGRLLLGRTSIAPSAQACGRRPPEPPTSPAASAPVSALASAHAWMAARRPARCRRYRAQRQPSCRPCHCRWYSAGARSPAATPARPTAHKAARRAVAGRTGPGENLRRWFARIERLRSSRPHPAIDRSEKADEKRQSRQIERSAPHPESPLAAIAATNHCHLLADCDANGRVPGGRSTARDRRCRAA